MLCKVISLWAIFYIKNSEFYVCCCFKNTEILKHVKRQMMSLWSSSMSTTNVQCDIHACMYIQMTRPMKIPSPSCSTSPEIPFLQLGKASHHPHPHSSFIIRKTLVLCEFPINSFSNDSSDMSIVEYAQDSCVCG